MRIQPWVCAAQGFCFIVVILSFEPWFLYFIFYIPHTHKKKCNYCCFFAPQQHFLFFCFCSQASKCRKKRGVIHRWHSKVWFQRYALLWSGGIEKSLVLRVLVLRRLTLDSWLVQSWWLKLTDLHPCHLSGEFNSSRTICLNLRHREKEVEPRSADTGLFLVFLQQKILETNSFLLCVIR